MTADRQVDSQTERIVAKWNRRFKRPPKERLAKILAQLRKMRKAGNSKKST